MSAPLLSIQNLSVDFIAASGVTHALKNISLTVKKAEILALVGESGSGKSVTSLSILQLLPSPPARYSSGNILFSDNGEAPVDLLQKDHDALRHIRGEKISMIFQEPMSSLNPVLTCGNQVTEAIRAHKKTSASSAKLEAIGWFAKV